MLAIGQELYQQTDRDLAGVGLEEVCYREVLAWPVGNILQTTINVVIPSDRMLYVSAIVCSADCGASASRLREANLNFTPAGSGLSRRIWIEFGDSLQNASQAWGRAYYPQLLLPKGGRITGNMQRTDTTVAGNTEMVIWGFLVPPGSIARGS